MMIVEPCGGDVVMQPNIWDTVEPKDKLHLATVSVPDRQVRQKIPWHSLQHAHTIQSLGHVGVNKICID
jgi:hypothetical protein